MPLFSLKAKPLTSRKRSRVDESESSLKTDPAAARAAKAKRTAVSASTSSKAPSASSKSDDGGRPFFVKLSRALEAQGEGLGPKRSASSPWAPRSASSTGGRSGSTSKTQVGVEEGCCEKGTGSALDKDDDLEGRIETVEEFKRKVLERYSKLDVGARERAERLFCVPEQGYADLDSSHNVHWKLEAEGLKAKPGSGNSGSGRDRNSFLEIEPTTKQTYLFMSFAGMLATSERLQKAFKKAKKSGKLVAVSDITEGRPSAFRCKGAGLYYAINPDDEFYGGFTMCFAMRMAQHAIDIEDSVFGEAKQRHPFGPDLWNVVAVIETEGVSPTELTVWESLLNVSTGAVGRHHKGLNTYAWDNKFLQDVRLPAAHIIACLDALHAHVDAGGMIPGKPCPSRESGPEFLKQWDSIIKKAELGFRVSPTQMYYLAYYRRRERVTKPYHYSRPFPRSAYYGTGPQPLEAIRVRSK